ncbi:MAG TPA: hypothetical protein VF103_13245 [Polyangiaceae bacterium]
MAERFVSQKRKSVHPCAPKVRLHPELLPALDPDGDPPSDPGLMIRPEVRSTLIPPPSEPPEPLEAMSLESLARALRRA